MTRRAIMTQHWNRVAFLHWAYDPDVVRRRLPDGLEVDTHDGAAWVGIVAFEMERIAPIGLPPIPGLGTFPETNVRTYVRGPDGTPGVWFDSLDASRAIPVLIARTAYRLPYFWSRMSVDGHNSRMVYSGRRRRPGPRGAGGRIVVEVGKHVVEPTSLEEFLTARWRLFTSTRRGLRTAEVTHPPWPLFRATPLVVEPGLVEAAGYSRPTGPPVALYSPGVEVAVTTPKPVGSSDEAPNGNASRPPEGITLTGP